MAQPVQPTVSTGTDPEVRAQAIEALRQHILSVTDATSDQAAEVARQFVDGAIAQRGG